ncbi:Maf family protein [Glaciecola sp. 2405UD65-10]|uniref:Maf family protein n=1 Tax=Glaciecola sp. 2405UD65-10 TaxID=3397244 RepID=UPI003B59EA7E
MQTPIILASASPRRKHLLAHLLDDFLIQAADVDESILKGEKPQELVERLAKKKAKAIIMNNLNSAVIGSDTVVACNEQILGKPRNFDDFSNMMQLLSNKWHQVFTGVCILHEDRVLSKTVFTSVKMTSISSQEAEIYWATKEPQDKAGGYAIQGIGGQFVEQIKGSFSAVVGLPLLETKQLLQQLNK